jgi:hypothetical protein
LRFYTKQECDEWLSGRQRKLPDTCPGSFLTTSFPDKAFGYYYTARWIASSITFRDPALLLITEWGIWPTSENWHLYYKLRNSYGDFRLLHEAPGHFFLGHEMEDLATFLQVSMLNGFGGYLLTGANYVNCFFSHDQYINFYADTEANLSLVRKEFQRDPSSPTPS